jgi:RimJ/RimL family protein N-acetyltransferase
MIEVVPFEKDHLDQLVEPSALLGNLDAIRQFESISVSGLIDGELVGCGGVFPLCVGSGEAWAVFSKLDPKRGRECLFAIKRRLTGFMQDAGFHRLQATVLVKHKDAIRMVRAIGFEFEGLMKAYDSERNDYARYGKVI